MRQIAQVTKIPIATLKLLEADNFASLPATPFVKGFIRNVAGAVGLDPERAVAVFRRDLITSQSGEIVPKGLAKPLNAQPGWSRKLMVLAAIAAVLLVFFGYLGWQLKGFLAPPELTVTQPAQGAVLKGPVVEVKGWVSADSSVWVNSTLAEVLPNGQFRVNISLLPGKNTLIIRAENRRGKTTEERLVVEVVDK